MLSLEFQLRAVGVAAILLGLAQTVLPRLLNWPADLAAATPMSRAVIRLHTWFVGLACVVLGALSLSADTLLAGGPLAVTVLLAQLCFWGARWLFELFLIHRVISTMSTPWQLAHLAGLVGWAWFAVVPGVALVHVL